MTNQTNSAWTDDLRKDVADLWTIHSATQISDILGQRGYTFSRSAVQSLVVRMGLSVKDKAAVNPSTPDSIYPNQVRGSGSSVGANAFKVIHGIKGTQRRAAEGIEPHPFVCQDASDVVPLRLTFADLERADGKCRWPYDALPDEPGEGSFRFCGHPGYGPYCRSHQRLPRGIGTVSERQAAKLPSGVAA